jgi:hypothetical protein
MLNQSFSNAGDINKFFEEKTGKKFIDYFNSTHATRGAFGNNNGKPPITAITAKNAGNWENVWNSLGILYGKETINLVEFLAINIAMAIETGSSYYPGSEIVGNNANPGISYAFNVIGSKKSYNTLTDVGNITAFKLYSDKDYIAAHGHKPFGNILKNTSNTTWDTSSFPYSSNKNDTAKDGSLSGFIFEADFMKFRGRGYIQTTGRNNYIEIIKFILSYSGSNATLLKYKSKWDVYGTNYGTIATVSSNSDWDDLFKNTDLIIPNVAVNIHAKGAGKKNGGPNQSLYTSIDVSVGEDKVLRVEGPVWWVGKRINGSPKYALSVLERVKQIIDDLNSSDPDKKPFEGQASGNPTEDAQTFNNDQREDDSNKSDKEIKPKVESLTNFFKPDENILKIIPIIYDDTTTIDRKRKEKFDAGYVPLLSYGNYPIESNNIKTFVMDSNGFLPRIVTSFTDATGTMDDTTFPLDDTNIKVFLHSRTKSLRHIFMQFKITNFRKYGKTIYVEGEADINTMFYHRFEAYQNMTSFEMLQEYAKKSGLGFNSNITNTNDKMTWINPGMCGKEFLQDVISRSYSSDDAFMWGYVDFYYNLNLVDLEKQFNLDISNQGGIVTSGEGLSEKQDEEKITSLYLTSDGSVRSSNIYFESYQLINQSSGISIKRAYKNLVKYYNTVDKNFNIYSIESMTSNDDNTIILKGKPQETDFFSEHITSDYTGKVDVDNMYSNFNYAPIQNAQNLEDIQKIGIIVELPTPNFNLYRFQKIKVILMNDRSSASSTMVNKRLSGNWIIIGISFKLVSGKYKQEVTLIRRELSL